MPLHGAGERIRAAMRIRVASSKVYRGITPPPAGKGWLKVTDSIGECIGRPKAKMSLQAAESFSEDAIADYWMAHLECGCRFCERIKSHWSAAAASEGKTLREWIKGKFAGIDAYLRK